MIDAVTIFAWLVMAILLGVTVAAIVFIGSLPGKIAAKRNHPQADAINAASWIGLAVGGVGWVVAFVWAFLKTGPLGSDSGGIDDTESELVRLRKRVADLEGQLETAKRTS